VCAYIRPAHPVPSDFDKANMKVITSIYLNCRPDLRDEWLTGTEVDDVSDAQVKAVILITLLSANGCNMIRHKNKRYDILSNSVSIHSLMFRASIQVHFRRIQITTNDMDRLRLLSTGNHTDELSACPIIWKAFIQVQSSPTSCGHLERPIS
jgi:hypothetical protein